MEHNRKSSINSKLIIIILAVILLALALISGYFYSKYQTLKNNPEQVTKAETEALVDEIGKLIDLPKDETPTLATVLDKEKLKDQPFFANAQNGDKILIYTKAKKAIVYRPKDKKIINVGPIAIDQKGQVQVALVNAGGDINSVENKVSQLYPDTTAILSKTDAKNKNNVKKTVVVDVNGQNAEMASKIAGSIGGEVGSVPNGETAPSGAGIVIFVK